MAGLVPAIHAFAEERPQAVDARHKARHDYQAAPRRTEVDA